MTRARREALAEARGAANRSPEWYVGWLEEAATDYETTGDADMFIVRMETRWKSIALAKPSMAAEVVKAIAPRLLRK